MSHRLNTTANGRCPICGTPARPSPAAPFCSNACRDRDLLRWLGEGYRIPGPAAPADDESSSGE